MANRQDDEFAAVASIKAGDGKPWRSALSTTASTITSLAAGRYIVILEGTSHVFVNPSAPAVAPLDGAQGVHDSLVCLHHGATYVHASAANLSCILVTGTGYLILQAVAGPG